MNQKKLNKKYIIIVVLLFLLSLLVLYPIINKPLTGEWLPATVLRHMDIWDTSSIVDYNFNPVLTYTNPGDRFINNHGRQVTSDGVVYYTSYPPFSYIAPYGIFQLFDLDISPANLRVFNVFFYLASSFILFLILFEVFQDEIIAIAGMSIYLFSKISLYCNSETYMADTFVLWWYLTGIYLVLRIVNRPHSIPEKVLLPIVTFFMIYTEWLGVFFAFTVFLYGLFGQKNYLRKYFVVSMACSCIVSLGLIISQYCITEGFEAFFLPCLEKYKTRAGLNPTETDNVSIFGIIGYLKIVSNYWKNYSLLMVPLFLSGLLAWLYMRNSQKSSIVISNIRKSNVFLLLCLATFPIICHYGLFFNFNANHQHGTVKTIIIFAVLVSILCHFVKKCQSDAVVKLIIFMFIIFCFIMCLYPEFRFRLQVDQMPEKWKAVALAITVLVMVLTVVGLIRKQSNYLLFIMALLFLICGINIVEYFAFFGNKNDLSYYKMGMEIKQHAKPNEIVILQIQDEPDFEIFPDMVFYAKRNVILYKNVNDSAEIIKKNGAQKGRVMTFEKGRLKKCELVSFNNK